MKKKVKFYFSVIIALILTLNFVFEAPYAVSVHAKSKNYKEILRSGKRTKKILRRGNRDSLEALHNLIDTDEWYCGAENVAPIDGTPTNQDELYRYLKQFYLCEIQYVIIGGNEYKKFQHPEDWSYDGIWLNYMPEYIFNPGSLYTWDDKYYIADKDGEPSSDYISYMIVTNELEEEEKLAIKRCKEIANEIKYLYPNTTAVEKAQIISEYLRGIATYNRKNYEMYELLFLGETNCQGYSDTFDTIMKYLNIPCAVVDSQKYNHAWNIFYQQDITGLKVYKIDVTNNWGPVLLDDAESPIFQMDYPDVKLEQLEIERKILAADDWEISFENFEERAIYKDDKGNRYMDKEGTIFISSPAKEPQAMPTMIPITAKVTSPSAITYTPTLTPTLTPTITPTQTPTPTSTQIPEDNVIVVQPTPQQPGTVTVVDDDEANRKVTYEDVPAKIDIIAFDIWRTKVVFTMTESDGKYELRYRHPDGDWKYFDSHKNKITVNGLKQGTTIYVQVRNVRFMNYGWNNAGEWSKSYKITTEE